MNRRTTMENVNTELLNASNIPQDRDGGIFDENELDEKTVQNDEGGYDEGEDEEQFQDTSNELTLDPEAEETLEKVQSLIGGPKANDIKNKKTRRRAKRVTPNKKSPVKEDIQKPKQESLDLVPNVKKPPTIIKTDLVDRLIMDKLKGELIIAQLSQQLLDEKVKQAKEEITKANNELTDTLTKIVQKYNVPDTWVYNIDSGEFVPNTSNTNQ